MAAAIQDPTRQGRSRVPGGGGGPVNPPIGNIWGGIKAGTGSAARSVRVDLSKRLLDPKTGKLREVGRGVFNRAVTGPGGTPKPFPRTYQGNPGKGQKPNVPLRVTGKGAAVGIGAAGAGAYILSEDVREHVNVGVRELTSAAGEGVGNIAAPAALPLAIIVAGGVAAYFLVKKV